MKILLKSLIDRLKNIKSSEPIEIPIRPTLEGIINTIEKITGNPIQRPTPETIELSSLGIKGYLDIWDVLDELSETYHIDIPTFDKKQKKLKTTQNLLFYLEQAYRKSIQSNQKL